MKDSLIYARFPGNAEGVVRCSLERTPAGPRVVLEQGSTEYRMPPTATILGMVTRNLQAITPEELLTGAAVIGPIGEKALQTLGTVAVPA
jgi:hypothetical protein